MTKDNSIKTIRSDVRTHQELFVNLRGLNVDDEAYALQKLGDDVGEFISKNYKDLPIYIVKTPDPMNCFNKYSMELTLISKDRLKELLDKERILDGVDLAIDMDEQLRTDGL